MASQLQTETLENFFREHPESILWQGDAAEFVLQPTELTQSIIIDILNNTETWQMAAQRVKCPLRFRFSQPYIKVIHHHSFCDLTIEAEMLGYSNQKWKVEDDYSKPKLQLPWWGSFLKLRYLSWQMNYLQPSHVLDLVAKIQSDFEQLLNTFTAAKHPTLKESIEYLQKGLSFILAMGVIEGLYEQYLQEVLKKKHGSKWSEIEKQLAILVRKDDQYFQSVRELGLIGEDEVKLENYLKKYGSRSFDDYELASPRFHELKDKIRQIAKTGKEQIAIDDEVLELDFLNENEKTVIKTAAKIKALRGTFRLHLLFIVDKLRQVLLQLAKELRMDGQDLFFYTIEEILSDSKQLDPEILKERKIAFELDKKIQLPMVLTAKNWKNLFNKSEKSDAESFKAMAVSLGEAKGKIVILDEESEAQVSKGSILILPDSSPKYTHLYPSARALIFRQGGMMSHGAIIAREYHIPAVSLSGRPHNFKNEQEVFVNATDGLISVIKK